MKVLVTGGTGFIGSHTTKALVEAGHAPRLLVRSAEKAKRVYEALGIDAPECVVGDVTDRGSVVSALEGCHAVLHAAALVALEARRAGEVERTNLQGTRNVVGEAHQRGLGPIIHVSSVSALFDPGAGVIGPRSEPSILAGSAYAGSKARSERWVRELQDSGAPLATTYPSGVLGPHAPELTELHRSLPFALRAALVTSGGVNFVDVRDVARLHAALLSRPAEPGRWLAGGHYLGWEELAELLGELTGRTIPRLRVPGPLLRGLGRLGDGLKRVVPFSFPLSYEAMVTASRWPGVDSSETLARLGLDFRDLATTLADTLVWMQRAGHLEARRLGRLAARGRGPA